jgi:Ca-activated chloride channel homolog
VRLAAWLCAALAAAAGSPQTFKTDVDAVRVDVLVTDRNRPVAGLSTNDFVLRDNGVLQRIDSISMEEVPFSMLLALDTSSSVNGPALKDLKQAARAAVGALRVTDRASVITFSDVLRRRAEWTPNGPALASAIEATEASGPTALFDAAFAALSARDPLPGRRGLIVLFTDGDDTASWLPSQATLDRTKRTDAVVYVVTTAPPPASPDRHLYYRSGIRLTPDADLVDRSSFLREIAERTGGDLLITDTKGLPATFERIVGEFRRRYLVSYMPSGVETTGWHTIDVTLENHRGKVTARRGYQR